MARSDLPHPSSPDGGPAFVATRFAFRGRLAEVKPAGSGNVNDTYLAVFRTSFSEERGILQRINRRVFKEPGWVIENMRAVTEHVHRRLEREADAADRIWQLPRLIPARDGRDYFIDGAGDWWRAMTVIASATSYGRARGPEHALEAGTVLGQFHRLVSDMDPSCLRDSLPGFHCAPAYLASYDETLREPSAAGRLASSADAARLARLIERRRGLARALDSALGRKELGLRLIHGDPKIDNIMIDDLTGKGTGIVDLDTVKPGLVHYDFGDAARSICNPAGEEARDLKKVRFDVGLFEAFVKGYLPRARDFLTREDRRYLYDSVRLIAFELGLRFFRDHLAGDVYFKIRYPGHNLRRAGVQLRLCESIEANEGKIRKALERHYLDGGRTH